MDNVELLEANQPEMMWGPQGNPFWPGIVWPGSCGPPMPCPPELVAKASRCWDQSRALEALIAKVLQDIINKNPNLLPQLKAVGPIIGVTDGSDAGPGEVGEFITAQGSMSYAPYPTDTANSISLIVVQPGDWDFTISASFSTLIGGAVFELRPWPVIGMSNQMVGYMSSVGDVPGIDFGTLIIGQSARGSFSVPTLLAFYCQVYMSGDSNLTTGGTMDLRIEGRRRR